MEGRGSGRKTIDHLNGIVAAKFAQLPQLQ